MARTRATTDEAKPVGITLAQYAGVVAGLGEGFSLEEVLENERVDPAIWPRAERAWMERLDDDQAGEWLLDERFDAHLASAQERYGRRIPPLHDDLGAWLDFLRIWSASEKPLEMLGELGLRASDLTRLHRHWSRRFVEEPVLKRAALSILEREPKRLPIPHPETAKPVPPAAGDPDAERQPIPGASFDDDGDDDDDDDHVDDEPVLPAAPPMRVALPRRLATPAPQARPEVVEEAPSPAVAAAPDAPAAPITFLEYASLRAELVVYPDRRESTYAKYGLSSLAQRDTVEDYWQGRLAADAEECAEWERAHDRMIRHWMQLGRRA